LVGIVGPSGWGKTTLLELVAGLRRPSAGTVSVAGRTDPAERLAGSAYMPQRDLLLPWLSALDNAALAPRIAGASREQARARTAVHLERHGHGGFEGSPPRPLSGGVAQREALLSSPVARA